MSYVAKTDWKHSDPISENDLNRWETGIKSANDLKQSIDMHINDPSIHVTNEEKNNWNAKAETTVVSASTNGLMSISDKIKLDSVAANANNYLHPTSHPASIIVQDASNRFVTDTEKTNWNNAVINLSSHIENSMFHLATAEKTAVSQLADDSVSSWITATLLNGWTTKFDRTVRFRRVGNTLHISGGVGGGTTGDGTSVFVLPVGMRPSRTVIVPIIAAGVGAILNGNALINRLVVSTGGNVTFSYGWNPDGWAIDVIIPL